MFSITQHTCKQDQDVLRFISDLFVMVQGTGEASACSRSRQAMSKAICKMSLDMKIALLQLVFCACYASVEEYIQGR